MKSVLFTFAAIVSGLIVSATAQAQATTEFFHQPNAGSSELTPHVGYRTSTTRAQAAGSTETNLSGLDHLGVKYEYGLNPVLALGVDLSYSSFTISNNGGDSRGLEPLQVVLDGQLPMLAGNFQYGLEATVGLEKAKSTPSPQNRSYGDAANSFPAGGFKIAPYLGYAFSLGGAGALGAKVSYELINSDVKVDTSGADVNTGGGAEGQAVLFYEGKAADVTLGGAFTYDWFTRVWNQPAGVETTVLNPRSLVGVKLYSNIPFGSGIEFLPSLTWREKGSSDDFDKLSDLVFTIAGRFTF